MENQVSLERYRHLESMIYFGFKGVTMSNSTVIKYLSLKDDDYLLALVPVSN